MPKRQRAIEPQEESWSAILFDIVSGAGASANFTSQKTSDSLRKICTPWGWRRRLGLEASLPSPSLEHVGRCESGGDVQTTHQFPCENANANL